MLDPHIRSSSLRLNIRPAADFISLEHINKYNTDTNIYTDGSKAENLVAAAYTSCPAFYTLTFIECI